MICTNCRKQAIPAVNSDITDNARIRIKAGSILTAFI
ncbi:hypothetical protein SAMN05428949_5970 [Chitinophaga sp. YR627]|nr:hypothetical protein SAMN05428949_5970 [Chitinophaga sp. YR627]